MLHSSYNTYIW